MDDLLRFVEFTHKFQQVERALFAVGSDRKENDAEHSFQLALLAWYIITNEKLSLDLEKVLKYAIAHDLVEVYAGDTDVFTKENSLKKSKIKREERSLERIRTEFSNFPELIKVIEEYEVKMDPESKFVYSLDKLTPIMNVFLDRGRSWRHSKVTYEMLRDDKDKKISVSPEVENIWKEFVKILENNRDLFHS